MVGEIAARLSGGYMSGWTFPLSSGVEVTQAAMNIAVGLPPGNLLPKWNRVVAERAFISIPGKVARVLGEEEARGMPGIVEVFARAVPGDTVVFPTNNVEKCGNVLAVADTRDSAERSARAALGRIEIRLEPLQEATTRFLFHSSGINAFEIRDSAILSMLDTLPAYRGNARGVTPEQPVLVQRFPGITELSCRDWHGLLLEDAVTAAIRGRGMLAERGPEPNSFVLCGLFWKAILRGSAQGARYLLDSVHEACRRGSLEQFLAGL